MRTVASLIPSGTDLVASLGLGKHLVGVSHECDHPIARGLPVLTASTLDVLADPAEIDAAVSGSVAAGESLYRTDAAMLAQLAPDVVLSQDVCDVCAVNGELVRGEIPHGAALVMLTAVRMADLWDDVTRVGRALGADAAAMDVVRRTQGQLAELAAGVATEQRVRVAAIEWGDPPFAAGHWVPELIDLAGGIDVLAEPGMSSRRISGEEVRAAEPDIVIFLPCGYSLEEAARQAGDLSGRLRLSAEVEIWATDATRLFSRCTPDAVVSGVRTLAGILHPTVAGPAAPVDARRVDPAG